MKFKIINFWQWLGHIYLQFIAFRWIRERQMLVFIRILNELSTKFANHNNNNYFILLFYFLLPKCSLFDFCLILFHNKSRKKRNIQKASKDAMNINTIKLNVYRIIYFFCICWNSMNINIILKIEYYFRYHAIIKMIE